MDRVTYTTVTVIPAVGDTVSRVQPFNDGYIGSVRMGDTVQIQSDDPAELEAVAAHLLEVSAEMRRRVDESQAVTV